MATWSKIRQDTAGTALAFVHGYSLQEEKEQINVLPLDETLCHKYDKAPEGDHRL